MAGNPYGNKTRCRKCHRLGSKDGWCKMHRPVKRTNPFRDNFKEEKNFIGPFEKDEFGMVREDFGAENTWR